jgi:hypothetical protein
VSKTILEKALLEAEQLEEAMTSNAKEILSSTMKEEINELVKESLSENDYLEEQEEEEEVEIDFEDEGEEIMAPELELDLELDMEDETEDEMSDELPPLDLTGASDDEVLKIFKAMGDEDGIIIQKDDEEIDLVDTNTNTEYIIKLDESEEVSEDAVETEEEVSEEMYDEDMDEEMVYEITLDEEEDEDVEKTEATEEMEGEEEETEPTKEVDETSRTLGMGDETKGGLPKMRGSRPNITKESRKRKKQIGESRIRKSYNLLKEEVESLKSKNGEYKKALITFKDKLNEVSVFNSNLAYVTRLFTEHSTTKQEKINILKRFDGVETLKESKTLYKVIKDEMGKEVKMTEKSPTISESVEKKIIKSSTQTKTSGGKLLESKVYENPQFSRMKDLMSKL